MPSPKSVDSFGAKGTLDVNGKSYEIYRLASVASEGLDVDSLPYSLKILLENLLRTEDGANITADDIRALAGWDADAEPSKEIQFTPARVIMQDFTGVPCIVDLATMREAMAEIGGDPQKINPLSPAEMVIDHSVIADVFGTPPGWGKDGHGHCGHRCSTDVSVVPGAAHPIAQARDPRVIGRPRVDRDAQAAAVGECRARATRPSVTEQEERTMTHAKAMLETHPSPEGSLPIDALAEAMRPNVTIHTVGSDLLFDCGLESRWAMTRATVSVDPPAA